MSELVTNVASISELIQQVFDARMTEQNPLMILQEKSGLESAELVSELAEFFSYEELHFEQMLDYATAFDLISYSDSIQRDCILLRSNSDELLFVFADVFNDNLQAWAVEKVSLPFTSILATQADIAAYLAKQEDSLSAVDSALSSVGAGGAKENIIVFT